MTNVRCVARCQGAPIEIWQGDITGLQVDAIVNAANSSLLGGGGVDGAIHRAAGPELLSACRALRGCRTGEAKLTGGFKLPAHWVVHTVGPVWQGGAANEAAQLASCYRESMRRAAERQARSIGFPCISTGVYGYPKAAAAAIAIATVASELESGIALERVLFCCFSAADADLYLQRLTELGVLAAPHRP